MFKLSFLKDSKKNDNSIKEDVLIELDDDEANKVMAVGNSVESGKWILNEDMKYLINKKSL